MAQQIKFFQKSFCDLSKPGIVITITDATATDDGQALVDKMRNRQNSNAWITTGSNDAANTEILVDFGDSVDLTDILLTRHNFKDFTIQYKSGASFVNFAPSIAPTGVTDNSSHFEFTQVTTQQIKIIITAAQVVNADKFLAQLIATKKLGVGQFEGWPEIKNPIIGTNKKVNKMLSGRVNIVESVGFFECVLDVKNWNSNADLTIVEDLFFRREGMLMWPSGGDETQFSSVRIGYRKEDLYMVRPINEYRPEFYKGLYQSGLKMSIKLRETVD